MNTSIDWRQLAHRWFVQYNPLYLVSAACVLLGLHILAAGYTQGSCLRSFDLGLVVEGLNEAFDRLAEGKTIRQVLML